MLVDYNYRWRNQITYIDGLFDGPRGIRSKKKNDCLLGKESGQNLFISLHKDSFWSTATEDDTFFNTAKSKNKNTFLQSCTNTKKHTLSCKISGIYPEKNSISFLSTFHKRLFLSANELSGRIIRKKVFTFSVCFTSSLLIPFDTRWLWNCE